ncbi:MAG: DUF1501 domain-containing protein [Planctomycetes bacterium]|nr:DUF1501 domain-containing protein [Planctomycetota bacterium]
MSLHQFCDGLKRRDFLRVGAVGGLGLTLADYAQLTKAGQVSGKAKAKSAIYIRLGGGPTHMDTFDMKPDAPEEYRGQLKPIKTNVAGVEFTEKMPLLAQQADKFAILRGVSHTLAAHEFGTKYMHTGNRPLPSLEFPSLGSVVSKELAAPPDMPPFVAIPNTPQGGGYLGLQYGAFATNATPKLGQEFSVRGIGLPGTMTMSDVSRREKLLASVDHTFASIEAKSDVLTGLDEFSEQAFNMISSKKAKAAFDLGKESPELQKQFGADDVGQSTLLAVRLVEAGVRFVTVSTGNWDMHADIYKNLDRRLPPLDAALSSLFSNLYDRGLLDSTLVMVTGEFGRTPKINQRGGRDHWPRAMFVLMGGGGVRGGQVIGASDDKGQGPANDAIAPDDVAASLFQSLGIDHHKEYHTNTGRPVMISRDGKPIQALFG